MWAELLELLLPSVCPGCDRARRPGATLLCQRCRVGLRPPPQQGGVHTGVAYSGTGARLVQRFKFDHRRDALAVLGELLVERVAPLPFDVVVPVARDPARIRALGGEPVVQLARWLSRRLGKPLCDVLERQGEGPAQTGLSQHARRENVMDRFRVPAGAVTGLRVLLIDDVTTTGATLTSASRLLRQHGGARSVEAAALAETPAPTLTARGTPTLSPTPEGGAQVAPPRADRGLPSVAPPAL